MPIRPVTDPSVLAQLNHNGVVAPNPMFPGQMQGQSDTHQRTQQEIRLTEQTMGANVAKARADALKAQIDAKNAQDAYNSAHPKGSSATVLGPESLKALSPPDQEIVKALAEGRLAFPAGFALKAPWWQQKLEQVAAYDPTFDATNFNNRAKSRAMLLTGKVGQSANALNTAIGHLGQLNDQIGGTASHNFTPANAVINKFEQLTGDPGITNFKDTAGKLASELTSVYRNGGGAEQDVIRQLQSLDPNASEAQKRAVVRNALDLLASKQAANLYQYGIGSGNKPPVDLLDPDARKVLDQFPDIRDKHFGGTEQAITPQAAALLQQNGGTPPPAGHAPPPTGPTNAGSTASTNAYNETADPQSAEFWASAAREGVPYRTALGQWQGDVKARGLVGITPPPPGAYHKAAAYIRDNPNVPYQPFSSITRTPVSPLGQATTDAAFSGPGVAIGHAADASAGNLPTALAGEQGARYNAVSNATHPNYALAGSLAGTIGGSLAAGAAVKGATPLLGTLGKALTANAARAGLAGDALYGGVSGAANNPDNPFLGAAIGAGAMAAGNRVGGTILGPAVRGGYRAASALGLPVDAVAAPTPGENMIAKRTNPVVDQIRGNLQDASNLGLPYSLADADPRLRMLAGSAARKSPDVRALAESIFAPRQLGQGERAIAQIDQNLAPVGDVPSMKADATSRAQRASKPLYEKAFAQPTPNDPQIMDMLGTPAGEQAARNAYAIALNSGEKPGELSISLGPDGKLVYNGLPNWKTLQYVKMGLDKVVTDNANPVTGKLDLSNPANRAVNDLRAKFVGRLGEINPDYEAANRVYSNYAKQGSAVERGAAATSAKVTPEQAQIAATNAGDSLPHFQQGYASDMADQIERSRMSGNPYNLVYGSLGQQAKIGNIFPQGAANFGRASALEGDMAKTGTELFGGSQTQPRAEADKLFDHPIGDIASDIAFGLATGVPPPSLIKRGLGVFAKGSLRLGVMGTKGKADTIAQVLMNPDPKASLASLDDLIKRRAYVQRTNGLGGVLVAPLIYGAGQNY